MTNSFKLGLVQDTPVQGDIEMTLKLMEDYGRQANKEGIGLLIFPELFITGYFHELWERHPTPDDEMYWFSRLHAMAKREGLAIVCGHPSYRAQTMEHGNSRLTSKISGDCLPMYNAASLVSVTGVMGIYAKVHLWDQETKVFTPGDLFPVWDTPWGRLAVQVSFDMDFPEGARAAALQGAEVLVYPTGNYFPYCPWYRTYTLARAQENGIFVASANRIGKEFDLEFCGGSCAAHPEGRLLIESRMEAGLYTCDVHLGERSSNYFSYRKPGAYRILCGQ